MSSQNNYRCSYCPTHGNDGGGGGCPYGPPAHRNEHYTSSPTGGHDGHHCEHGDGVGCLPDDPYELGLESPSFSESERQ